MSNEELLTYCIEHHISIDSHDLIGELVTRVIDIHMMFTNPEDQEQAALFEWAKLYDSLRWLHHIPNGGHRHKATAKRLKVLGVKRGIADLCLPVAMPPYYGLYIEMKRPDKPPRLTKEQKEFMVHCEMQNYRFAVCQTWQEAKQVIQDYMKIR